MDDFLGYEEPVSRVFWSSDDLEEESTVSPTFTLEWSSVPPTSIKTLVVVSGNFTSGIIDQCLSDNVPKICTIDSSEEFNVAQIKKLSEDTYVCTISKSINLSLAGKFLTTVSSILSMSERIIVFTDEIITCLNGDNCDNQNESILWKSLSNSKGREHPSLIPSLKSPNFIAGIAAGVISYAEMIQVPATVNIMYKAEDAYDTEIMKAVAGRFTEVTKTNLPNIECLSKLFNNNKLKLYM